MTDFFYRTEDIKPDEVLKYYVATQSDREIVNVLKNANPTILVGSRGVGKSFLLRVAQQELLNSFDDGRVFPVYVSFVKSSLIQTSDPAQFTNWMLAKICSSIIRALSSRGLILKTYLFGQGAGSKNLIDGNDAAQRLERITDAYENSWQNPDYSINTKELPSVDQFRDAMEDLCSELNIKRIAIYIDEAAHIFLPEQQRQFFTLFRDLRHYCITCNAAVYPGVTSFGDTFQPAHDATLINIDRSVQSETYIENMREIVEKQADSSILNSISQNKKNFAILAFAATGNPRILLKTLAKAPKVNSAQLNEVIREYFRTEIWSEHSLLATKYTGHKEIIDWGRTFIENFALPELKSKNERYLATEKSTSAFIWIHRDSPEAVKEALRILTYTGILIEHSLGIKATRSEIGTRYLVNLGCLLSLESAPASNGFEICKGLTPQRMTELGGGHSIFRNLVDYSINQGDQVVLSLDDQLAKDISVLDITPWQQSKLRELALNTVRDVLGASEARLKDANYIGDVRARRMRNAAVAAVLEYLSG